MKASGKGSVAAAKQAKKNLPAKDLTAYLVENREQIEKVKPRHLSTDRFIKIVARAVYTTPTLARCSVKSIFLAALQAAELGLEPGGVLGHAALVPYWNSQKNSYEAQFQCMYKGLLTLAYNTGMFKMIDAREVYENDDFQYSYGFDTEFYHKPAEENRGTVIGYYAFFVLKDGGTKFEYMSRADADAWAKRYSKAYKKSDSPWHNFFDEMAKKTVLRKVLKMAPLRIELPVDREDIDAYGLKPNYQIGEETISGEFEEVEEEKEPEEPEKPEEKATQEDTKKDGKNQDQPQQADMFDE